MMTEKNIVQLVNKGGKIVGVDPETGETVPIELDEANIRTANIEDLSVGEDTAYNLITNNDITVTVNSNGRADYKSIQAAVDDAPNYIRHEYVIDVQNGHNESVGSDGHVNIEGIHHVNSATGSEGFTADGDHGLLRIQGNRDTPSKCKIDTLAAFGCTGVQSPTILGFEISGDQNLAVDEDCCVSVDGCTEAFFADCHILDGEAAVGLQVYRSFAHIRDCNIDSETGISLKRQAHGEVHGFGGDWTNAVGLTNASQLRSDASISSTDIKWSSIPRGETFFRQSGGLYFPDGGATWGTDGLTFTHNTESSSGNFRLRDNNADIVRFKAEGRGWGNEYIEDLSGQTGDFDGQIRLDDGTNTSNRGIPCTWNNNADEWVPHDGGSTFT